MKKTYIIPAMDVTLDVVEQIIAASVTTVDGDAGIDLGDGEAPAEADIKGSFFGETIFD